ncbi:hypothetical protein BDZ88DRAFT_441913 [Geranomyces variabilis]|nr:hypothetical protein BDZ88DRAFT_441913 [Geranomyces variabilis]
MLELLVVGANHVTMALVSHLLSQVHPCKSDESRKSAYLCDSDGDSDSLVEHGKHCEKEVTSPEKWLRDRMLVVDDDEVMPMDLESLPCPDVPFLLSAVVKIRPVACPCAAEPPLAFYHLPIAKFCDHFVVTLANGRELQARNVVVAGPRQTAVPKWAEQGRNGLVGKCQGCGRVVVIGNCLATCSQALTTFSHVVLLLPDHMAPEIKDPRVHSRRVRERPCRHVHHHLPHHYHVLSRAMQDGRLTVFECADVQGARYEENDGLWELWLSEGSWVVCEWVCSCNFLGSGTFPGLPPRRWDKTSGRIHSSQTLCASILSLARKLGAATYDPTARGQTHAQDSS